LSPECRHYSPAWQKLDDLLGKRNKPAATMKLEELLEIHKTLGEEMRHTATVIWQFAVAILTLQGGAIALSGTEKLYGTVGNVVVGGAFFVSFWFSVMLLRQAVERAGFIKRIKKVEEELRKKVDPPELFAEIKGPPKYEKCVKWFTSIWLAGILIAESLVGLVVFLVYLRA
jgi:hypothetical protein